MAINMLDNYPERLYRSDKKKEGTEQKRVEISMQ